MPQTETPYERLALQFIKAEEAKFATDEGHQIFDLKAYDISDTASPRYQDLIQYCRSGLAQRNIAILPNFVRPEFVKMIADELAELEHKAFVSDSTHNPYFTPKDASLAQGHPVNIFDAASNGFIAFDDLPEGATLKKIFFSSIFIRFLSDCVGEDRLYPFADPLTCMTVNIMKKDQSLGWHFDTPKFSITLSIDQADEGGAFEFSPNVRKIERGVENHADVAQILKGDMSSVDSFVAPPGSLQIFMGRNAIHRVSNVARGTRRMAIFSYDPEPGQYFHPKKSLDLFGRTGFKKLMESR